MTHSRRSFLAFVGFAAVSPGIVTRAVIAPRSIFPPSGSSNPAWVLYDLCAAHYGAAALDRESFARMAAVCDEPVGDSS